MTELERLQLATATAKRMGLVVGMALGASAAIVGTVFVIARWFARCH